MVLIYSMQFSISVAVYDKHRFVIKRFLFKGSILAGETRNILEMTGMVFYNYQLSSVSTYCNYATICICCSRKCKCHLNKYRIPGLVPGCGILYVDFG